MTLKKSLDRKTRDLIESQYVMTLGTCGGNIPWTAPVYYVFSAHGFFFFSSARSRHIVDGTANASVAAAVFNASESWKEIRGVQMTGRIEEAPADAKTLAAFAAYTRRFPFIRDFMKNGAGDLNSFKKAVNNRFYRFVPGEVFYQDNSIGFGFREKVRLNHDL